MGNGKIRYTGYILAACLCLMVVSFMILPGYFQERQDMGQFPSGETIGELNGDPTGESEYGLPGGENAMAEEEAREQAAKTFVEVSSLLTEDTGVMMEQTERISFVPVGRYRGVYTQVRSAPDAVLAESVGTGIATEEGWYRIAGHEDMQYLIRHDGQTYSLWKFQSFDCDTYPYAEALELVYGLHSADGIREIRVEPATMDNTDAGKEMQKRIGIREIKDRNDIETIYQVLTGLTCYGSGHWEKIDYGLEDAPADRETGSAEAVRLGRYLSIVTDWGNEIDGLKYTAFSDMFYEYSGIAYDPLEEEQAEIVRIIFGISKENDEE